MDRVAELHGPVYRRGRLWGGLLRAYLRAAPTWPMRFLWRRNLAMPFGELVVIGRRTGRERRLLVNAIEINGRRFIGHPNGHAHWTRNIAATEEPS